MSCECFEYTIETLNVVTACCRPAQSKSGESIYDISMVKQWMNMPFFDPAANHESMEDLVKVDECVCGSSTCGGCLPPPDREQEKSTEFIDFEKAMVQYETTFKFQ